MTAWLEQHAEPEPTTGCWLWTGRLDGAGYGRTRRGGYAHREAWQLSGRALRTKASGEVLHHRCHQRRCVNVAHLELRERGEHMREHWREKRLTPEEQKAKRRAYMQAYLPIWRARRKALSVLSNVLLSGSARPPQAPRKRTRRAP